MSFPAGSGGAPGLQGAIRPGDGGRKRACLQARRTEPEPEPDSVPRAGGPGHPEEVLGGHPKTSGSQEGPG